MKRSTDRILTTHTGSLPRPPDLCAMIDAQENGELYDQTAFSDRVRSAVSEVVRQQVDAGVDIVSDGEQSKPSFATYVKNRLSGLDGQNDIPRIFADRQEFAEWNSSQNLAPSRLAAPIRPTCNGPLGWNDRSAVDTDIANLKSAVQNVQVEDAFIPSASLGIIAEIMLNEYYLTEEAYLYALADVMKEEYRAITDAGFILQLDAPDAAMGRHAQFWDKSLEDFRSATALRVEAVNHALQGIPDEQVSDSICAGATTKAHTITTYLWRTLLTWC